MEHPDPQPRELTLSQRLCQRNNRHGRVRGLGCIVRDQAIRGVVSRIATDARAHDEDAVPCLGLLSDPLPHPGDMGRLLAGDDYMRDDRCAPRRQLGQGRDVDIAEDRHGDCSRDGGSRHDEDMRTGAIA